MTREEEIELAWLNKAVQSNHRYDEKSFKEAIEWADKTMLDRACEWLNDTDFDMEYWNQENGFCKEEFITDFKQAMEGGAE